MQKILAKIKNTQSSNKYPGYLKIQTSEYKKALVEIIKADSSDIIGSMNLENTISDLELRITKPAEYSASGRLTAGILKKAGTRNPLKLSADEFNHCSEEYYRVELREKHIGESFDILIKEIESIENGSTSIDQEVRAALNSALSTRNGTEFVESLKQPVINGDIPLLYIVSLIHLLLVILYNDMKNNSITQADARDLPPAGSFSGLPPRAPLFKKVFKKKAEPLEDNSIIEDKTSDNQQI